MRLTAFLTSASERWVTVHVLSTTTSASSTHNTLTVMTWVAVIFTPLVLLYQGWSFYVFRKRIGVQHIPA